MKSRFFTPALVGGTVIGVLSALPIISAGNICCCLWVVLGGVVAAYLLQQSQPGPITPGDGALAGVLSGVVGAFVSLALSIPITLLLAPLQQALLRRITESMRDAPPWLNPDAGGAMATGLGLVVQFLFMLFAGPVFATLGGLIGAMAFRKAVPPSSGAIDAEFSSRPE